MASPGSRLDRYETHILPCQSPAAGPVWRPPGPAGGPSAPHSPAPDDSSSFPRCPADCGDGWTRPSPPGRTKKEGGMEFSSVGLPIIKHQRA